MKIPSLRALALSLALTAIGAPAAFAQSGTLNGLADDAQVNLLSGVPSVSNLTAAHCRIGHNSSNATQMGVVHVFEIPPAILADSTRWFDASTYSARLTWINVSTRTADLYGLGYRTTPTVLASDAYVGALDSAATLIKDNFLVPGMTNYTTVSESGTALVDYLNAQLTAARSAGASSAYVFFRTNMDATASWQFYQLGMTEGGGTNIPTLDYSTFSQPAWVSVPLGGGGYVTGIISDSSGTDIYIRTDVGGALRWVESAGAWISITDTIVPTTTPGGGGLMSIASIALDPNNPDNLYVAAGNGKGGTLRGIYASADRGATWTAIETSIVMDGNGGFRSFGERLAVDPNNSDILWFGSHSQGLWKGVKSGSSWTWAQIPSGSVPFGQVPSGSDKGGVTFVACDPNNGSTLLYAGVYDSVGSTGGVYRSTDGGSSWAKIAGTTVAKPARGQVAPDGTLYVTANGVVAKMPRGGSFSAITPVAGVNYRAIATDPNDSTGNTVYTAEASGADQYNKIWRSTNGGSTWAQQHQNLNDNRTIERAEPDGTPALTGYWFGNITSLLVNPANSDELWAGDFFGVARTRNANELGGSAVGSQAVWYMLQKNQEETVVEALKNAPSGPALLTGVADVGGYRYDDLSERPQGAAGNVFSNPGASNTTSLDFCESSPDIWVRAWSANSGPSGGSGGYSRDGGVTWLCFGQIDHRSVARGPAGWEEWDLTTYLAAQKAKGVGAVTLVVASGAATNTSTATLNFDSLQSADLTLRPRLLINGSATLIATADAMVAGAGPSSNYGSTATLGVSYAWGTEANERHTYLKFDLTASPVITSAVLRLHRTAAATGIVYPVGVYACLDTSWTESALTWSNRPAPYASRTARPANTPRYRTAAGLDLSGGRAAISATNADQLVWMPYGTSVVPHYSHDRGVTWFPATGLPDGVNRLISKANPSYNLIQLASDRSDGSFYIARFAQSGGQHYIYRSTNGGEAWSHVGTIPFTGGTYSYYRNQIAAAPSAGHVWVSDDGVSGTTNGGLWKSTDGAVTWSSRLANIRAVRQVAFGKAPSGSSYTYSVFFNGYLSGVKGVYRSDDYGATWIAVADLPTNTDIESLAGDRQIHGGVFLGTAGRGVFHYQP